MDPDDSVRVRKVPWFRRRAFIVTVALPPVLFCGSNLWLALPSGRDWIGEKITARTGLPCQVGGASWSPWGGINLRSITLDPPPALKGTGPLLEVASIRAWPAWKSWLRLHPDLQALEINTPRGVIPLQLFAHAGTPPARTSPPLAIAAPPAAAMPLQPSAQPGPIPRSIIPEPAANTPPTVKVAAVPESRPPLPPARTGAATAWVKIRAGSFCVVAGDSHPLFEASGIDADIPAGGDPADSQALIASVKALGQTFASQVQVPLRWEAATLQFGPGSFEAAGVPCRFAGKMAPAGPLPLHLELDVAGRDDQSWTLAGGPEIKVKNLRGLARFNGLLATPATWQGEVFAQTAGATLTEAGNPAFVFDHGLALAVLRGGMLSCPDARLIGNNLSLLGNATLLPDGRGAATLRVVAEPGIAKGLADRIKRNGSHAAFSQLGTPDRLAMDLGAWKTPEGFLLQLGEGGDMIDAHAAAELLKAVVHPSQ